MFGNKAKKAFGLKASNALNTAANANANGSNKQGKRKAECSPTQEVKRCALGDISNAAKGLVPAIAAGNGKGIAPVKAERVRVTRQTTKSQLSANQQNTEGEAEVPVSLLTRSRSVRIPDQNGQKPKVKGRRSESNATDSVASSSSSSVSASSSSVEDPSFLYTTAVESPEQLNTVEELNKKNELLTVAARSKFPDGVTDFDHETGDDPSQVAIYAQEIFLYYKYREKQFPVVKYLNSQLELNKNMRCILVDWMVEVQESFELNHETLYLAVKIIDLFLGKVQIPREKLQLVGTTAFWVAAKFDERTSPSIDDFCYICDDAYPMSAVLKMEVTMLKALKYDIGFPLSYRFLRRYARVGKCEMETLTLARFVLESALMEYDFIDVRDSVMAGAALLLALYVQGNRVNPWTPTLLHYTGYNVSDLYDLAQRLLTMLRNPPSNVKTIRAKYSHTVFFQVAKIPLPEEIKL